VTLNVTGAVAYFCLESVGHAEEYEIHNVDMQCIDYCLSMLVMSVKNVVYVSLLIKEPALDGPIPWTTKNNLAFIAEQVSHHPPS